MPTCDYTYSGTASSSSEGTVIGDQSISSSGPNTETQPKRTTSDDTASAELIMSQFRELVGSLFRAPAARKCNLRAWVVDDVAVGRRLTERVECILEYAVSSPKPSRLDDAIDILDQPKVDLTTYFRDTHFRASFEQKHDDAIYVLLRSAGRRSDHSARFILPWALKSGRASVREAAVEALADLGTEDAISMLHSISKSDSSPSVRDAAEEALEDTAEA